MHHHHSHFAFSRTILWRFSHFWTVQIHSYNSKTHELKKSLCIHSFYLIIFIFGCLHFFFLRTFNSILWKISSRTRENWEQNTFLMKDLYFSWNFFLHCENWIHNVQISCFIVCVEDFTSIRFYLRFVFYLFSTYVWYNFTSLIIIQPLIRHYIGTFFPSNCSLYPKLVSLQTQTQSQTQYANERDAYLPIWFFANVVFIPAMIRRIYSYWMRHATFCMHAILAAVNCMCI